MDEIALIARARTGDHAAFTELVAPHLDRLRAFARRFVGDPSDADDLVQDTLVRALEKLEQFRADASLATWLHAIVHGLAIDHLRRRARWRVDASQQCAEQTLANPARLDEVAQTMARPDYQYEAREHIAFCFDCVARSLPPEEAAALVAIEVCELPAREAAKLHDTTESVLRHRVASARRTMTNAYDHLCGLVSKRGGVCYQCANLRDRSPVERRGEPPPDLASDHDLTRRLAIVRSVDWSSGGAAQLHRTFLRWVDEDERSH